MLSLDHVALWVDDRDALAGFLCAACGMHEIERTDSFTLVGGDARQGKLTLFAAEGPRERGPLERIALAVPGLAEARQLEAPAGVPLELVPGEPGAREPDLSHVVLRVPDPDGTAAALSRLGMALETDPATGGPRLHVAGRHLVLVPGGPGDGDPSTGPGAEPERPLLNHLAFLVASADDARAQAEERGLETVRVVDAPNTLAAFVQGPDGLLLELVEHKPTFSLR